VQQVTGVNLTPRTSGYGFPTGFSLQYSTDGATWTNVPGQTYTGYPNPGSNVQAFTFSSPVQAQYIRLYATQLGTDNVGTYYLQLAQMAIRQTLPFVATASSADSSSLGAGNVTDGISSTFWSSSGHTSAASTEWVQLDLGTSTRVQDLRLVPRDSLCFPAAFAITYSNDGSTWYAVPGQSYSAYANPASVGTTPNPVQLMNFSTPVTARYFRITATQLTADTYGNYYFQLADIFVDQ